jgi:hypothetical protein
MFSEQDVDRELKAALSVSPSPDFEARVLQRVEADRRSYWPAHYGWFAAAAASVVIVAGAFYALTRTPSVVAPSPAPQVVEQTAPPASAPPRALPPRYDAPAARQATTPPRVDTVRASRNAPRTTAPEVIVPLNQMEAVHRLVHAVNEGRLELPAEPLRGPLAPPAKLDVAPLVIEPIPVAPVDPGAGTPAPTIRGLK